MCEQMMRFIKKIKKYKLFSFFCNFAVFKFRDGKREKIKRMRMACLRWIALARNTRRSRRHNSRLVKDAINIITEIYSNTLYSCLLFSISLLSVIPDIMVKGWVIDDDVSLHTHLGGVDKKNALSNWIALDLDTLFRNSI